MEARSRALETSEKLYRAIGESINYGVWVTDADGKLIYISDSFLRLVGMTMQQALDEGWGKVLHPDGTEVTVREFLDIVRQESTRVALQQVLHRLRQRVR